MAESDPDQSQKPSREEFTRDDDHRWPARGEISAEPRPYRKRSLTRVIVGFLFRNGMRSVARIRLETDAINFRKCISIYDDGVANAVDGSVLSRNDSAPSRKSHYNLLVKLSDLAIEEAHYGSIDAGWRALNEARRQEIFLMNASRMDAWRAALLQEAKDKITNWRGKAIKKIVLTGCPIGRCAETGSKPETSQGQASGDQAQSILMNATPPSSDLTDQARPVRPGLECRDYLYVASLLRDGYTDNVYFKLSLLRKQISIMAILLAAGLLAGCFLISENTAREIVPGSAESKPSPANQMVERDPGRGADRPSLPPQPAIPEKSEPNKPASSTNNQEVSLSIIFPAALQDVQPPARPADPQNQSNEKSSPAPNEKRVYASASSLPGFNDLKYALGSVFIFGAIGACLSVLFSVSRAEPKSNSIPAQLETRLATYTRPLVGGASAVIGVVLLKAGIVNIPIDQVWSLWAISIVLGFSERLIVGALEGVKL